MNSTTSNKNRKRTHSEFSEQIAQNDKALGTGKSKKSEAPAMVAKGYETDFKMPLPHGKQRRTNKKESSSEDDKPGKS